jgi:hypothetical protein
MALDPIRERTRRRGAALRVAREMYEREPQPRSMSFAEFRRGLASALWAWLEYESLMSDERFRLSLEQMRRGERAGWPDEDYVSAAPGEDWREDD